jgi:flagellar biosynthesis protein FlhF
VKLICFVADNAADALSEVHDRLGPNAVIISVRALPEPGLGRLWNKKRRIEVTAGVPDKTSAPKPAKYSPPQNHIEGIAEDIADVHGWRCVAWLKMMGLAPANAGRLLSNLRSEHGEAPDSFEEEWEMVLHGLSCFWRKPPPLDDGQCRPHVFIGPPGSGKTTALCKWLTLTTLLEARSARAWRLDGSESNTAEFLGIHCETLGVPLERFWLAPVTTGELCFVDLPGVEVSDTVALAALRVQLASLPSPRVHLVLNAAYETQALLAQWRAFEACAPEDFIFTHLDEEMRRVKLWNFVIGTNCSLRFLGAGKKIPGEFRAASPEFLFPVKSL